MEVHTISLTSDNMEVVTSYLTNGTLGRNLCFLNSPGKQQKLKSFTSFWIQSEYNLSSMLSKHWELLKILQVIHKLLSPDLNVNNLGKNKENRLKKTHVIQINGLSTSHTHDFHHLHKNIHIHTLCFTLCFIHAIQISTRTCHINHKRGVTEVCHFAHF